MRCYHYIMGVVTQHKSILIRLSPDTHQGLRLYADARQTSVQRVLAGMIERFLADEGRQALIAMQAKRQREMQAVMDDMEEGEWP
jgi:isochorismate synthase EntC